MYNKYQVYTYQTLCINLIYLHFKRLLYIYTDYIFTNLMHTHII